MELISIISTVKNGEKTINQTIDSVLEQTYSNWEFVIVDDGSTDRTNEIIKEYALKDKRIAAITTAGIGRGKALNKAISNAKGNYVCNLDADDVMHPDKLKVQVKVMEENKDYFLLSTDSILIYDNETPTWNEINIKELSLIDVNDKLLIKNQINHSAVMLNKQKLLNLGGYNETRRNQFDYELWLRAYSKNEKIGKINKQLVAKRIHKNQSFENKKRIRYLYDSVRLQMYYITFKTKKIHLSIFPILRFILGLLPFKVRRIINDQIRKMR